MYYNNIIVGKIYYYSNRVDKQYFENVVVKLNESPCFKSNTFVTGQLFYDVDTDTNIFNKNKNFSFKSLSTGGTFSDKNIKVSIKTDETLIRYLTINMEDYHCDC